MLHWIQRSHLQGTYAVDSDKHCVEMVWGQQSGPYSESILIVFYGIIGSYTAAIL